MNLGLVFALRNTKQPPIPISFICAFSTVSPGRIQQVAGYVAMTLQVMKFAVIDHVGQR
jgi:hypothetical protein